MNERHVRSNFVLEVVALVFCFVAICQLGFCYRELRELHTANARILSDTGDSQRFEQEFATQLQHAREDISKIDGELGYVMEQLHQKYGPLFPDSKPPAPAPEIIKPKPKVGSNVGSNKE